eukprot:31363-Pelagococcus_subviridis.AAC.8
MRRQKSLRIGVHNANAVVWGPVYRTCLAFGNTYRWPFSPAHRSTAAMLSAWPMHTVYTGGRTCWRGG